MNNQTHNISEKISRYLSGKSIATERHAIEREALENPLLRDSLDGLEGRDIHGIQSRLKTAPGRRKFGLPGFGTVLLTVAIIVYTVSSMNKNSDNRLPDESAKTPTQPVEPIEPREMADLQPEFLSSEFSVRQTDSSVQVFVPRKMLVSMASEGFVDKLKDDEFKVLMEPKGVEIPGTGSTDMGPVRPESDRISHIMNYKVADYSSRQAPSDPGDYLTGISASHEFALTELEESKTPYNRVLNEAIGAFAAEDYSYCLGLLKAVLQTYPDDLNALFYCGMAYFKLERFEEAEAKLALAERHYRIIFKEEARFYRALSLVRTEKGRAEGRLLLEAIKSEGGFYSKRAAEQL
jgi:hypothetical protein